jgi:hypothetical protein
VRTSDIKGAGTDANVTLSIAGEKDGKVSRHIHLIFRGSAGGTIGKSAVRGHLNPACVAV